MYVHWKLTQLFWGMKTKCVQVPLPRLATSRLAHPGAASRPPSKFKRTPPPLKKIMRTPVTVIGRDGKYMTYFSMRNSTTWRWFPIHARWSGVLRFQFLLSSRAPCSIRSSTISMWPFDDAMWRMVSSFSPRSSSAFTSSLLVSTTESGSRDSDLDSKCKRILLRSMYRTRFCKTEFRLICI